MNGFSHKSSALRVAAYFNPANKTWIARHKRIARVGTEQIRKQDNYYGYGSQLIEAIEGVVQQIGVHGRNVFCRVILPDKHLARLRVDFSGTV